ncbi:MAG: hypothetical protein NTW31_02950 [Bacteroidetes bacterium]|nr:hypothetical protein [Bacteroidota bacterium]
MIKTATYLVSFFICWLGCAQGHVFAQADSSTKAVELATDHSVKSESGFQRWLVEKPKGLYNNTSFAIVSGRGNVFSGMQTAFGYKFNPHLGIGGGIGIERITNLPTYSYYTANFTFMPIFAEVRYTILKTRFTPVIALQGGYKVLINTPSSQMDEWMTWIYPPFAWNYYYNYDTYTRGGLFANLEIGVNAKVYKRFGVYASVDYSVWSVSGTNHYWVYNAQEFDPGRVTYVATEYTQGVVAYQGIFMLRLGFTF